jgi:hypothetical protein
MNGKVKNIVLAVSLVFNLAVIFFIVRGNVNDSTTQFISFERVQGGATMAQLVTAPLGTQIVFEPPEITLRKGERATLQISYAGEGKQGNWIIQAMYDPSFVSVQTGTHGIVITALELGECVIQTLNGSDFIAIARVRIIQ